MAVTAKWYTKGPKHLASADVNWGDNATTTIKVMLCTSSYTVDQDAHEFKSSVTNEVSGAGYTAGGQAVTSRAVNVDTGTNESQLDGADMSWSGATFTARTAVVYKDTGSSATSILLGYVDFGADVPVSAGTLTITWDATGVLKIVAA